MGLHVEQERAAAERAARVDDAARLPHAARGQGPDIAWFKDPAGNILAVIQQDSQGGGLVLALVVVVAVVVALVVVVLVTSDGRRRLTGVEDLKEGVRRAERRR